jgi:hypothetical protein
MSESKEVSQKHLGEIGHRVAVIGIEIFGSLNEQEFDNDNYSTELYKFEDFNKLGRLTNYTLCLIGYDAFNDEIKQSNFIKQMIEATEEGVNFCFLYYNENSSSNRGTSRENVGYQVLKTFGIGDSENLNEIIREANVRQQEFRPFLRKWGATNLRFASLNEKFKSIYESDDFGVLGFSILIKNAEIFFIPYIRDHASQLDLKRGLETLIDNLLTYLAKSRIELPSWAKEFSFFTDEENLISEKNVLRVKLIELDKKLQKFDEAKSLLFHHEHHLEISLPKFLKTHLGLRIEQNETYKEDFWLIDENDEKTAISEIKSASKGFKLGMIYKLLAHKYDYDLSEDFPSLLFVNCNLQAGSYKDKDKNIDVRAYKEAARKNVLIIRIEDVIRLWEKMRQGQINEEEILNLFLNEKGWLHVKPNLEIEIKP